MNPKGLAELVQLRAERKHQQQWGKTGLRLGYIGRRAAYDSPDAYCYPATALVWALESRYICQMLLGLFLADASAEEQYAGVAEA
ncbi:hypothetical protein ACX9I7_00795 [Streptomyces sp. L500]